MTDKLHRLFNVDDGIHYVQAWTVEDQDALSALVVTADDVGRVARVLDDYTFWILVVPPEGEVFAVWSLISSSGSNNQPEAIGDPEAGSSQQYARGDHVHAHGDQVGGTLHAEADHAAAGFLAAADKAKLDGIATSATNTPLASNSPAAVGVTFIGVSATAARSDHVHAHGNQAGGALHADVMAGGASGFMTGTQATKLAGINASNADPADLLNEADPGASADYSRADHVHPKGPIYTWYTVDEAERLALVVTTGDVGKVAFQEDTLSFWFLAEVPTEGADVWRTMITDDQADAIEDNTAAIVTKADARYTQNPQSGTTLTLTDAMNGQATKLTNASGCAVTVPNTLTVGSVFAIFVMPGAGQATFTGSGGLTVSPPKGLTTGSRTGGTGIARLTVEILSSTEACLSGDVA